ncbi:DUF4123 domain-containing protein [Endozoicomonas sp. SM1973]|uniref:DUF4123 domain-containing protein n=1 Tax=Spartinivicinus marinus TaxID=2994442 RepID=A0A853ICA5_9GAMM|nr:DUF4123 domain-containing protein [Spartinivicinus marinus]MCX4028232.1 DUF4123 domain-containing protein [Spartinivicinus marinus]NYZ69482.1 DUF4123 domain-containing protein [Spartinivicinus marinus]
MKITDYLNQHIFSNNLNLYGVIDTVIFSEFTAILFDIDPEAKYFPLYKNTQLEACIEISPYLVSLTPSSKLLNFLTVNKAPKNWGIFLATNSNCHFDKLILYLQSIFYIKSPESEELIFRYYDPRVINPLLQSSNDLEKSQLLGPVEHLIVPNHYHSERFQNVLAPDWVLWLTPEPLNSDIPGHLPWYEFSNNQWQSLLDEHRIKVEETIANQLISKNQDYTNLTKIQMHNMIQFWIDQAAEYGIEQTKLVIRLIEVMNQFGQAMPEKELNYLESAILENKKYDSEEKVQLLEKYAALVYENPELPFDPIRCITYEMLFEYDGTIKPIKPFDEQDMGKRVLYMNTYQKIRNKKQQAFQAMGYLYQYYQSELIDSQQRYIPVNYFSHEFDKYRVALVHFYALLTNQTNE